MVVCFKNDAVQKYVQFVLEMRTFSVTRGGIYTNHYSLK
jgi:hypothetical protein